jgi:hypothetical protein
VVLVTIVGLLALFALGAILLARSSHRRLESTGKPEADPPPPDAWREAGRRLTPRDARGDD